MNPVSLEVKIALLEKAQEKLQYQIKSIKDQLVELQQAGAEGGKSSAGDKYETQGEMLKQSRDILEAQWSHHLKMLNQLGKIPSPAFQSVQEGALVQLSIGCIWICVPLGKLVHEGREYQLISKESPLYMSLQNLKAGESTLFRGKYLVVEDLV